MESNSDNIIIYILFAVIITFVIHSLFKRLRKENMTIGENKEGKQDTQNMQEVNIRTKHPDFKFIDYDEPHIYEPPCDDGMCSVPLNKDQTDESQALDAVNRSLFGQNGICPPPVKNRKQYFSDFYGFRDLTENNSSQRVDAVDRVQQLYLDGNLDEAHRYPNMKIRDLFDEVTATGPSLYQRSCVRVPKFDDVNFDEYYMSPGTHPMQITGDTWLYPNERVMSGGEFSRGLQGVNYVRP